MKDAQGREMELKGIKPPLPTNTLRNSRNLRSELTDAERKLWSRIRARQLEGVKFRRQHPIPPYIADFCCIERRLIIELDGSQHNQRVDEARTRYLARSGWRILRFWDSEVLSQTDAVLEAIRNAVEKSYPHPNPSPEGRGALEPKK
ncbi:endonuclease domain-containing protein [Dokdonella sp.]|uniref:endonuclease domain-containing protein n=1 Tax=Dokdonella sp. TaxID=2291710 RepID=UPI003528BBCF